MRIQDKIIAHIKSHEGFLDFTADALISYLDYEHAKPFLKEDVTEEKWKEAHTPLTEESVLAELKSYMEFAWGKVEGHRGISANRSVDKLSAWVWLLGDDETLKKVEEAGFAQYGAPKLAVICEKYGLPIPSSESVQRMIRGEACSSFCEEGCGG